MSDSWPKCVKITSPPGREEDWYHLSDGRVVYGEELTSGDKARFRSQVREVRRQAAQAETEEMAFSENRYLSAIASLASKLAESASEISLYLQLEISGAKLLLAERFGVSTMQMSWLLEFRRGMISWNEMIKQSGLSEERAQEILDTIHPSHFQRSLYVSDPSAPNNSDENDA